MDSEFARYKRGFETSRDSGCLIRSKLAAVWNPCRARMGTGAVGTEIFDRNNSTSSRALIWRRVLRSELMISACSSDDMPV